MAYSSPVRTPSGPVRPCVAVSCLSAQWSRASGSSRGTGPGRRLRGRLHRSPCLFQGLCTAWCWRLCSSWRPRRCRARDRRHPRRRPRTSSSWCSWRNPDQAGGAWAAGAGTRRHHHRQSGWGHTRSAARCHAANHPGSPPRGPSRNRDHRLSGNRCLSSSPRWRRSGRTRETCPVYSVGSWTHPWPCRHRSMTAVVPEPEAAPVVDRTDRGAASSRRDSCVK